MENRRKNGVFEAIRMASVTHRLLTAGTVLCVAASVAASLVPPLLLARIIDGLTAGLPLTFPAVLLYFGSHLRRTGRLRLGRGTGWLRGA